MRPCQLWGCPSPLHTRQQPLPRAHSCGLPRWKCGSGRRHTPCGRRPAGRGRHSMRSLSHRSPSVRRPGEPQCQQYPARSHAGRLAACRYPCDTAPCTHGNRACSMRAACSHAVGSPAQNFSAMRPEWRAPSATRSPRAQRRDQRVPPRRALQPAAARHLIQRGVPGRQRRVRLRQQEGQQLAQTAHSALQRGAGGGEGWPTTGARSCAAAKGGSP